MSNTYFQAVAGLLFVVAGGLSGCSTPMADAERSIERGDLRLAAYETDEVVVPGLPANASLSEGDYFILPDVDADSSRAEVARIERYAKKYNQMIIWARYQENLNDSAEREADP
jgi:hypothetical protein